MKAITNILSVLAVPALVMTAQAAEAPKDLAQFKFPLEEANGACYLISIAHTEEFVRLQGELVKKLQGLSAERQQAFMQSYNPDMLIAYAEDLWDSKEAYDAYKSAWEKRQIQTQSNIQGVISLKPSPDQTWLLEALLVNRENSQAMPLSISSLTYNPQNNTWSSSEGELTPTAYSATDEYVYRAQTGTEWELTKQDTFTNTKQVLRIAKTTDGKAVFISFATVSQSRTSGQVLSQQAYTLLYPVPQAGK